MPLISVRTSGPVEIRIDGGPPPAGLRWRKHTALLVYLLLSPRFTRTRSHLLGLLWGDKSEGAARHSLNEALRVLRRAAGDEAVRSDADIVTLDGVAMECDALRFDAAAAHARWLEAASLVAGDFLEGFDLAGAPEFEDWIVAERERRRARSIEALAGAASALRDEGRVSEALRIAERAVALDPLSERAARELIVARALGGDPGSALEEYARLERSLASALGAAPTADTRLLAERIRREPSPPSRRTATAEGRRTPLIARGKELATLLEALEACRAANRPALLVIEADTGTGRSRLAEEVALRARLSGMVASVARAVEADLTEPGGGIEALAAGGLLDSAGIGGASATSLAALAERIPAWADRFPHLGRTVADPSLPHAFADLVRAASHEQALLLAVDDARWLDAPSLLALLACLREGGGPVALLLTLDPRAPRIEVDAARARIGRELSGAAVRLTPLDGAAIGELAAWALPGWATADLERVARRIHADSGGLPLLAVELLHAVRLGLELAEAPAWPPPARTLDATRPGELPDAVVAAIRIGFRRLGEDARSALCALAVLGGRAPAGLVGAGAALDEERVTRALDELEWERWVVAEPRGYGFTAAVAGEVVGRDMVTRGQRQRILSRAGRLTPA